MRHARTWTRWNPLLLGLFALLGCGDGGPAEPNEPVDEPEPVRTPEASSCWAPSSPMLAWWPAEESAEDVVGNHHGTLTATVRYEDGYVGKAFSLGGSEAFVRLDEAPSARSFTVEAWIRPNQTAGREAIYGTFFAGLYLRNGRVTWWQDDNAAGAPTAGVACMGMTRCDRFVGTRQLDRGEWHHIALAYDGREFRGYVDGLLAGTSEFTGGRLIGTGSSPGLGLWARDDFPYWFTGMIDELAVHGQALSPAEIEAIWNAGSKGKCPS